MQLTDLTVLQQLNRWLQAGEDVWLCSVVSTYGSAPRPVGSLFATNGSQRVGSISGGCLEQAFFEKLIAGEFADSAQLFDYNSQLNRSGRPSELPCGGSIQLLVERLQATSINRQHAMLWLQLAESFQPFERSVGLGHGGATLITLASAPVSEVVLTTAMVTLRYAQVWSIVILGISAVSEHVARLALMAGYRVRLCDNREEMAESWNFNASEGGIDVEWADPAQFVERHTTARSAVLALAHDPRVDDVGLMAAFNCPNFYLGALGSQATTRNRRARLQRICQLDDATLDTLHAPIGLDIGSKTPVEIAISIMADLILAKSKVLV
ncbi:xanthine dehydrogenase accessory factor [Sinobacterium caligoides]|uniref:Xanthine dehydrogenase accessory factor n=1 Tax=Sinobacterium caligoides TaxID=933926 RepID=A0A3N2DPH2_9GAMM|nr:XdhC/CoxI family protein [Sinobacterium caligoides]ROS01718.1 xanthine dehydrogenase accessory factor [Sinobacterium caligoides]